MMELILISTITLWIINYLTKLFSYIGHITLNSIVNVNDEFKI
jgi:hypothetical protein